MDLNNTQNALDELGHQITDFIKEFLVSNDKVKTGKLKDSVDYIINRTNDGFEIQIKSENYMEQVDKGMKVGPASTAASYINRLKFKGNDVPPTDIFNKTIQWIIANKQQQIADATGKDVNSYIKNLFSDI